MSFSSASSASLSPLSPNAQGTADYGRSSVNGGGRDRTGISRTTTTSANNNRDDYGRSQRYHPDLDRSDYSRRPSDATSISSSSSNAADRLEALSSRLQSIRTAATATSPGMSRSNSSSSHMHSSSSRSPAMAAKRRSRSVDLDMDGPASAPVGSHHHDLLSPPGRYGAGRAMDRQGSAGSRWRSPSPPSPTASHASSYSQNPRWADRSHGSRVNPVSPGYESSETRWRSPSPTNSVASSTRDYRKKKTDDSSDFLAMLHQRRSRNNDVLVSADRLDDRSRDFRDHAPVTSPNSDDSLTTFEKSLSVYSNSSLLLGSSARGGRGRRKVLDLQEDAKSPESPRSSALRGPRDANFLDSRRNKDSGTDHLPQSPESLGSPASRDERDYGYGARSPNPSRNPRDLGYGDSRRERSTESRNWGDFRERDARDRERATYQRDDVESVYSDTTRDDLLSPISSTSNLSDRRYARPNDREAKTEISDRWSGRARSGPQTDPYDRSEANAHQILDNGNPAESFRSGQSQPSNGDRRRNVAPIDERLLGELEKMKNEFEVDEGDGDSLLQPPPPPSEPSQASGSPEPAEKKEGTPQAAPIRTWLSRLVGISATTSTPPASPNPSTSPKPPSTPTLTAPPPPPANLTPPTSADPSRIPAPLTVTPISPQTPPPPPNLTAQPPPPPSLQPPPVAITPATPATPPTPSTPSTPTTAIFRGWFSRSATTKKPSDTSSAPPPPDTSTAPPPPPADPVPPPPTDTALPPPDDYDESFQYPPPPPHLDTTPSRLNGSGSRRLDSPPVSALENEDPALKEVYRTLRRDHENLENQYTTLTLRRGRRGVGGGEETSQEVKPKPEKLDTTLGFSRYTLTPIQLSSTSELCDETCTRHSPLLHKIQRLNARVVTLKTKVEDLQKKPWSPAVDVGETLPDVREKHVDE